MRRAEAGQRPWTSPNDLIFRAAELKARHPVSYADAFALARAGDSLIADFSRNGQVLYAA